mmetsp:Transcript_30570/g.52200  ORF Transcript_30570/g.52200 Transcript_30570/m.52200 type:complete len:206 (+) Transcript_30570:286-903(+)
MVVMSRLRRRRRGLVVKILASPVMVLVSDVLFAHHAAVSIHGTVLGRGSSGLALSVPVGRTSPLRRMAVLGMMPPTSTSLVMIPLVSLAPHLRNRILRAAPMIRIPMRMTRRPLPPLPIPIAALLLLLLLLPAAPLPVPVAVLAAAVIVVILLRADLVADASHFVEAAFRTVADDDFPSPEHLFLAEADGRVADASALGVVFGCV